MEVVNVLYIWTKYTGYIANQKPDLQLSGIADKINNSIVEIDYKTTADLQMFCHKHKTFEFRHFV